MTTYTLSYWVKVDREWTRVVKPIEALGPNAAKAEASDALGQLGRPVHRVTLKLGNASRRPLCAAKRKNTQAWKPRRYGRNG